MSKKSYEVFRGQLMGANLSLVLKALSVAEEAHAGVMRKDGTTPYIDHPVKVASMLYDLGIRDEIILSAALLHDVVEDTNITTDELARKLMFDYKTADSSSPGKIVNIVDHLTIRKEKDDKYFDNIKKDPKAVIIKLADRVHNLSTLYAFTPEKKLNYLDETVKYIYPMINYAQHHYYEYSNLLRTFDLWIESIVKNLKVYMENK